MIKSPPLYWDGCEYGEYIGRSKDLLYICSEELWDWFPAARHSNSVVFHIYDEPAPDRVKIKIGNLDFSHHEIDDIPTEVDVNTFRWLHNEIEGDICYVECYFES